MHILKTPGITKRNHFSQKEIIYLLGHTGNILTVSLSQSKIQGGPLGWRASCRLCTPSSANTTNCSKNPPHLELCMDAVQPEVLSQIKLVELGESDHLSLIYSGQKQTKEKRHLRARCVTAVRTRREIPPSEIPRYLPHESRSTTRCLAAAPVQAQHQRTWAWGSWEGALPVLLFVLSALIQWLLMLGSYAMKARRHTFVVEKILSVI